MALTHDIRIADNGLNRLVAKFFDRFFEATARRKVYRETLRELRTLSPRELDDLGIHQSMITRVAQEAAYGK